MAPYRSEWDSVPADVEGWEVDPHWLELQHGSGLPESYMPSSVAGPQARWRRVVAVIILLGLIGATAAGICLTYGPHELFHFQQTGR